MKRLKPISLTHSLPNEPRRRRQAVIRFLYIASLLAVIGFLGDLFLGSLFYLRGEGLVLGDVAVIAAEFPLTVRETRVHEGDSVSAGDVAAIVSSQSVVESIARLSAELANRETQLSALRVRREAADAIIGFAEARHNIAADTRKGLETIMARGLLASDRRIAAVETEYRSEQDLNSLRAEKRVIEGEVASLTEVLHQADAALGDLRQLYDNGRMRVPMDGIVGRVSAEKGAVIRIGDPLFDIYGQRRYILGYLPTGGLYEIRVGDRVWVETGLRSAEGIVTQVEPIAAALPREFQRAFTPVDRQQVIRIEFAGGEAIPPLFTKVRLRSKAIIPHWVQWIWG